MLVPVLQAADAEAWPFLATDSEDLGVMPSTLLAYGDGIYR